MEHYIWIALLLLSFALTWQDLKSQEVNLALAVVNLIVLALGIDQIYQSLWVFGVLWGYKQIRKNSIQPIDVALFSLGAGHFSITYFSVYCLLTAFALVILFKFTHEKRLPFIVAWTVGFWGTYFLKMCVN